MAQSSDPRVPVRVVRDSLGELRLPERAYYGAHTQRAVQSFPISTRRFRRRFLQALGRIKRAAAEVNGELGELEPALAEAIARAASEVERGEHDDEFVVDLFQTGSGTSTHMNANEVIANRAAELLELPRDSPRVHPNDHVNRGQSSNDVMPSALHVAAREALADDLLPALRELRETFEERARAFEDLVKLGRTHLQDATPLGLGQEFSGFAAQLAHSEARAVRAGEGLAELALGGTAVGTGLNAPPGFAPRVIARLSFWSGREYREAANHFEAQGARDAAVEASGALKTIACSLMKIANDLRLLASGPRAGLGEIRLPELLPGSSIMPGKVNPVLCEAVTLVAAQVIGNDAAITVGGLGGQLQLNAYLPVIADNLLESIEILARVSRLLARGCVRGIQADPERLRELVERSLFVATALSPQIGSQRAAEIAREAHRTGRTIREVAAERSGLAPEELDRLLDPRRQTGRG
jgi:fumarate hydratase class II